MAGERVLVCGATGTTGTHVLQQLRAAGSEVRALTRSDASAATLRADGVETVVADLGSRDSLGGALAGIGSVYVANPSSPRLAEHEGNLAQAAVAAGVGHLVKLSVIGAAADAAIDFQRLHHAAENAVRASGIATTMVRPNGFMQNTLAWAAQIPSGVVRASIADARWSIVDARDIAAVGVAALRDPTTHTGQAYTVTGPAASSPREQVAILADVLGLPLQLQEISIQQDLETLRGYGVPEWTLERLGELLGMYAEGFAEALSPDIQRVLGRAPSDYRQFAQGHRAAFGGDHE